jgi:hypothetical protein
VINIEEKIPVRNVLNTLILSAIITYRNLSDVPSFLLTLTVLSSFSYSLSLCSCIIFPMITALLTAIQTITTTSSTNPVLSIQHISPIPNNKIYTQSNGLQCVASQRETYNLQEMNLHKYH